MGLKVDDTNGAPPGCGPGVLAVAGEAGTSLGRGTAPPEKRCDIRFVTVAWPVGLAIAAMNTTGMKMSAVNATPVAASFRVRPAWRLRGAALAQRECLANGVGPVHVDDPTRISPTKSSSSSS